MKCAIVHSWQPGGLHDGGDIFCDNLTNFSVIIEVYESDSMTEACGSVTTVRTVKLWQTKELGMCRDFKLSGLSMRNRTSVSSQFALVWHPKASLPVYYFCDPPKWTSLVSILGFKLHLLPNKATICSNSLSCPTPLAFYGCVHSLHRDCCMNT